MKATQNVINFSIGRVSTEQFAIIEENYEDKVDINLNTSLRFAIDSERMIVAVFCLFQFEQKNKPFLKLEVSCHFNIAADSWTQFQKDTKILIPKDFMSHLGMITVGTGRGVLHTKTESTRFHHFVLPTINVNELVKEDVTFAS